MKLRRVEEDEMKNTEEIDDARVSNREAQGKADGQQAEPLENHTYSPTGEIVFSESNNILRQRWSVVSHAQATFHLCNARQPVVTRENFQVLL